MNKLLISAGIGLVAGLLVGFLLFSHSPLLGGSGTGQKFWQSPTFLTGAFFGSTGQSNFDSSGVLNAVGIANSSTMTVGGGSAQTKYLNGSISKGAVSLAAYASSTAPINSTSTTVMVTGADTTYQCTGAYSAATDSRLFVTANVWSSTGSTSVWITNYTGSTVALATGTVYASCWK